MADVKWIKIVTDIFDDEKILLIESLPEADSLIVIWFKLLCLAGKTNNSGVFTLNDKIPYTDEMLAVIFRRSINTVRLALSTFDNFGMIEIANGIVTIPNWGKHQSTDMLQDRRDYMKQYMSDYRSKQKKLTCKVNSKANVNLQEEEEDIDIDIYIGNKHISDDAEAYKAAKYLDKRICENIPSKQPANESTLQRWAADIDKINRIDKQSWDDISDVLIFSQSDPFWKSNILSGKKLREKYFQLLGKMRSTNAK